MDYIRLSPENLESEHICCAISNAKDPQVIAKKQWLAERLGEGLIFLKADARGKCFQGARIFKRPAQRMYPRQPRKGQIGALHTLVGEEARFSLRPEISEI